MDEEAGSELGALMDARDRMTSALNLSGKFWVEAQEIDGLHVARLAVSDKMTGRWMSVEIELTRDEP